MVMNSVEHKNLEEWAKNYGGTAILGFICTLLIGGKFLHHMFQRRGLVCGVLIIPPAMMGGVLGLLWFTIMDRIDPTLAADLGSGLECVKGNLINFVFASLILGLTCARTTSHHTTFRGVMTSLLHEGMPMVIYSQILMWGQSTCCLLALCVLNVFGCQIPKLFAAMVPLGLEAGADIVVKPMEEYSDFWSSTVVEEAESIGLVLACVMGILMVSFKPYFIAKGWLGSKDGRNVLAQGLVSSVSSPTLLTDALNPQQYMGNKGDVDKPNMNYASLGSHLSLIALTVFLSFGVSLTARLVEIELDMHRGAVSGVRMFKLSMCCALFSMMFLLRRTNLKFNRDWFMRLCGLMLDLLFIASLSKAYPKPENLEETHYLICSCFVLVCFIWNIFCFLFVAKQLFPNFWFERGLVLSADCIGHSYTGLLFARTLDPSMESPVPAAYAYKLMLFFIPSSGSKNAALSGILRRHGPWSALAVGFCIVSAWLLIFSTHFKDQFVMHTSSNDSYSPGPADRVVLNQKTDNKNDRNDRNDRNEKGSDDSENASFLDALSFDDHSTEEHSPTKATRKQAHSENNLINLSNSNNLNNSNNSNNSNSSDKGVGKKKYKVQVSEESSIVKMEQIEQITAWLPDIKSNKVWTLQYSLRRDGASLQTLLSRCALVDNRGAPAHSSSVIIVQDSWGYVFGGYIAHALENKAFYYGNGESFVFSLKGTSTPSHYKWTGDNNLFIVSDANCFAMGGGGGGFAFQLDDELDTGVSNQSATYNNGQLSSSEFFKCLNVEVWILEGVGFSV